METFDQKIFFVIYASPYSSCHMVWRKPFWQRLSDVLVSWRRAIASVFWIILYWNWIIPDWNKSINIIISIISYLSQICKFQGSSYQEASLLIEQPRFTTLAQWIPQPVLSHSYLTWEMTTLSSQLGWSVVETGVAKRLIVFNGKTMPGATLTSLWEALEDTAQNGEPQMTNLFSSEEEKPGKLIKMLKWSNLMGQLRFWDSHLTRVTSNSKEFFNN